MKVKTLDKQSIFLLQNRKNRLNIISNSLFNINELHCQFIKLFTIHRSSSFDFMAVRNFDWKNIKRRLQIVLNKMKLRLFYINYIAVVAFILCIKQLCLCVSPNFWFCGSYQMVVTQAWNMPQGNETLWLCKYATNKIYHKVNFCDKFYSMQILYQADTPSY